MSRPLPADLRDVDLMSRPHKADPFPFYARLRAEAPVFQTSILGIGNVWLVTRYDDVVALLKDKRFAKDPRNAGRRVREPDRWEIRIMSHNLLRFDDPRHLRLRSIAAKAFRQCGIDHLDAAIEEFVGEHLDRLERASDPDLVRDFAHPVPLKVISELMGIPREAHARMDRWMVEATAPSGPPDMAVLSEFLHFMAELADARRERPQSDLLSALAVEQHEGTSMSRDELVATAVAILIAGHETVVNLFATGSLALMQNRDQAQRLGAEPDLVATAVEELLRFAAPVEAATERFCREDLTFGGAAMSRGDVVLAAVASANRDESVFAHPDRLDLGRDPNPHVEFGFGAHFCLGAALAQRQAATALPALFRRFPQLAPAQDLMRLPWKEMPVLRGLSALPVTW